jgi:hypothetical protein
VDVVDLGSNYWGAFGQKGGIGWGDTHWVDKRWDGPQDWVDNASSWAGKRYSHCVAVVSSCQRWGFHPEDSHQQARDVHGAAWQ